jgi:acyl-coenzyme A thioesterase PaaI-like protein
MRGDDNEGRHARRVGRRGRPLQARLLRRALPVAVALPQLGNLYPQFRLAGIRIKALTPDRLGLHVELRQHWFNTNNYGSIFGGSLYAMCDPFLVLLVAYHLGPGYRVWDKGADIRFRRPGHRVVRALFAVTAEQLADIRRSVSRDGVAEVRLAAVVHGPDDEVVAEVSKIVYVRAAAVSGPPVAT